MRVDGPCDGAGRSDRLGGACLADAEAKVGAAAVRRGEVPAVLDVVHRAAEEVRAGGIPCPGGEGRLHSDGPTGLGGLPMLTGADTDRRGDPVAVCGLNCGSATLGNSMNADAANEVIGVVRGGKVSATSLDGFVGVTHNRNLPSVRRVSSL